MRVYRMGIQGPLKIRGGFSRSAQEMQLSALGSRLSGRAGARRLAKRLAMASVGLRAESREPRAALVAQAEAIAHAGDGEDVAGAGGAALDLAAQVADVDVDEVCVVVGRAPDGVEEVAVGEDFVRVGDQLAEQVEFGLGEVDLFS